MENKNTQKQIDKIEPTPRVRKRHYIRKVVEVGLIMFLFSLSVTVAMAFPITSDNISTIVNQERQKRGLNELECVLELDNAVYLKTQDMLDKNYFEHYNPNGLFISPWEFMNSAEYDYLYAGENLAMDFDTAEGVVGAWMLSNSHRKNILNPDFEDMCVGVVKGEYTNFEGTHETTMVTQMFGREKPAVLKVVDFLLDAFRSLF